MSLSMSLGLTLGRPTAAGDTTPPAEIADVLAVFGVTSTVDLSTPFTDYSGDETGLTYSIVSGDVPIGMGVSGHQLTGKPLKVQPWSEVTVQATDGAGYTETTTVNIGAVTVNHTDVIPPRFSNTIIDIDEAIAFFGLTSNQTSSTLLDLRSKIHTAMQDPGTASVPKLHKITWTGSDEPTGDIKPTLTGLSANLPSWVIVDADGHTFRRLDVASGTLIVRNATFTGADGISSVAASGANVLFENCNLGLYFSETPNLRTAGITNNAYFRDLNFIGCHLAGGENIFTTDASRISVVDSLMTHFSADVISTFDANMSFSEHYFVGVGIGLTKQCGPQTHGDIVQFGGADRQTSQVYASVLFLDPATYGGSGMRAQGENIDNTSGKDNLLDWRNTVVGVTGTQVSGINDDDQEGLSYARNLTIVPPPGVGTKGNGGFYVGPSADVVLDIADFIAPNTADYSGLSGTTLYTNNNAASIDTLFPNLNGSVVALSKFANYAGAQSIYMPPDLSAGFNLNDWLARVSTMYEPNGGWPVGQDPANYTPFATWPEAGNLSTPTVTALTHTATELTATCSDAGGWIYAFVSSKETTGTFAQLRHGVEHDGHFDGSTDDPADVGNPQGHVAVYRVSGSGAQTYTLPQNAAGKYVHVVHEASDGAHTAVTTSAEAFVPSDVASLAHNWSFSDTASLTGDPVTQINDLEGAVNLTAVNGPARTALNGLTAGDFDGTNDGLEDTAGFTATAKTVVAVARPDVIAATSILNNRGGIGTNDRLYISTSRVVVGGTVFNYSPALSTVSPSIIVSTVSGVNTTATVNVHVNGDTTPVTGSAAVGTLAASFGIGKYPGSSTAFFNGVIGEVLIFDAVLSTLDRQKVEGYLANKWGVTLEAGHPYEDAPP